MQQETALGILKTGRNVYLTGAAGSGKTHALNLYIEYLRKHNVSVGVTASTGIAATHLGGMTIHAWSGIGIKDYLSDWDIDAMTQRKPLVKRLERTSVLIVDEVSMLRPEILDMVDAVSRAMKRVNEPFGGMQVVLSGDFFQLPPIIRDGSEEMFVDSSKAWHEGNFRVCYLTEQFRQEGGKLLNILNDIRDGEISIESQELLEGRIQGKIQHDERAVVLHTHNKNVDARNKQELEKLTTETAEFEMISTGRANLVETLKKNVLAPDILKLKVGARVMFVKNSPEQEYVNGTLGEITNLDGEYPTVLTNKGKEIVARPVSWETSDDGKVLASVSQVPLRLAWAITVHKSQGMSLDTVEVDLSKAFAPGQGYVALSRSRTLEGLLLHGLNATALQVHPYVHMRDEELQAESLRWENVFTRFSKAKVKEMQSMFIDKVGRTDTQAAVAGSIPTHLKTRLLFAEGKNVEDAMDVRGMTKGTILSHLEKLKKVGDSNIFEHIRPKKIVMQEIERAFTGAGKMKLAPVHRALMGKYTYEELRLARLFIQE